jgi:putative flavoprotein involved in K+ transport
MPFPGDPNAFPTKDEMADYLEAYATHFALPVRSGVRVTRLSRDRDLYIVDTTAGRFEAPHVVVAMSTYQEAKRPDWARELDPAIVQIHSRDYRNPSQLRDGDVLMIGAGNSGAEIAMELSRTHRVWLSGRDTGHVPVRMDSLAARVMLPLLFRVVFHRILTIKTPMGRKARQRVLTQGGPLIRVKPKDLDAAGVQRAPRTNGTRDGLPLLADGRRLDVTNVIWCTGFHGGFSWIDLPVIDSAGEPQHEAGIVRDEPGLYFVGLHFLYSFSSTMIHGVARDAERIAATIGHRLGAANRHAIVKTTADSDHRRPGSDRAPELAARV